MNCKKRKLPVWGNQPRRESVYEIERCMHERKGDCCYVKVIIGTILFYLGRCAKKLFKQRQRLINQQGYADRERSVMLLA